MRRAAYEKEKAKLQVELLKAQRWIEDTGQKVVMLFEGRDAAGKGGTIKRFMEHLNPRMARVVALSKPTDRERSQWYFQRYIEHLPASGEMVLFDRSWYNRAGVERVMGFCTPTEYLEFMREAPEIERMLTRSGILLFKYWFSVTQGEQLGASTAREGSAQAVEAVAHRQGVARQVGRLHRSQGSDVLLHRHRRCALDHRQVRLQEARAAQLHEAFPVQPALSQQGPPGCPSSRPADRRLEQSRHRDR
jgi:polyphosphate kinase 2